MFLFRNLLHFPSIYRDRERTLKEIKVIITNTKYNKDTNELLFIASSNNYEQQILLKTIDGEILSTSSIKVNCTCASFTYEFAKSLNTVDGLLDPKKFKLSINKPSKEKNINQTPSGCKHLIATAQFIQHYKSKFEGDIK